MTTTSVSVNMKGRNGRDHQPSPPRCDPTPQTGSFRKAAARQYSQGDDRASNVGSFRKAEIRHQGQPGACCTLFQNSILAQASVAAPKYEPDERRALTVAEAEKFEKLENGLSDADGFNIKPTLSRKPTFQDVAAAAHLVEFEKRKPNLKRSNSSINRRTAQLRQRLRDTSRGLIDPRTSRVMPYWDVSTAMAIVFTAFVTPYEVAFLPSSTTGRDGLFILNRIIDLIFVIDMFITFRLVYSKGDGWVTNRSRIVSHYLKGWFLIDLVSIAVSSVDVVIVVGAGKDNLSSLRILRALRALRLIKLVRLFRASRIFKRWETKFAIDYSMLEVVKCLVAMLIGSHWFGCFWTLQASLASDTQLESWLGNYGYCAARVPAQGGDAEYEACPDGYVCNVETPGVACLPPSSLYAASVYWAVMTITSIGYGDIAATPYNSSEQIICTFMMLVGAGMWGYVIGTFCSTIANLSPETVDFRRNMDDLNGYLRDHRVAADVRVRMREYFFRTRHLLAASNQTRLLGMMSPTLQAELVLNVSQRWVKSVSFLNHGDIEPQFIVMLNMALAPMILSPFELAPPGFLYILCRGVVVAGGELLTRGMTWGDDIILNAVAPQLVWPTNAKSINHAEVYLISWDVLEETLIDFPASAAHIRRCAVRMALKRQILRVAAAAKRAGVQSMLDVSDEHLRDADRAQELKLQSGMTVRRSPTRNQSRRSPLAKRSKTTKEMLLSTASASEAEVNLQTHLINLRRNSSASLKVAPVAPESSVGTAASSNAGATHTLEAAAYKTYGGNEGAAGSDEESSSFDETSVRSQLARQSAAIQSMQREMQSLSGDVQPIKTLAADLTKVIAALSKLEVIQAPASGAGLSA